MPSLVSVQAFPACVHILLNQHVRIWLYTPVHSPVLYTSARFSYTCHKCAPLSALSVYIITTICFVNKCVPDTMAAYMTRSEVLKPLSAPAPSHP